MAASTPQEMPKLKFGQLRRNFDLRGRRYGRQDFNHYYDITKDVSIGRSSIEGVSVDCRFVFSKTRLGILRDRPGGILYMNLTIEQPQDWKLKEASVTVILEDAPTAVQRRSAKKPYEQASVELVEEYFGPKHLVGPETVGETTKFYTLGPQFEGGGFGGSLREIGQSVKQPRVSWWNFRGTAKTANDSSEQYTTLKWVMSPNNLAYTNEQPVNIQTAFSFSHLYQPFILRVDIDGKLRHLHRKFKDKTVGLFTKTMRRTTPVILFEFDPDDSFEAPFLEHAKGLESEMVELACRIKQIEVPPRSSSAEYTAQQLTLRNVPSNSNTLSPPELTQRVAGSSRAQPDSDLAARLYCAHSALMNIGSRDVQPNHSLHVMEDVVEATAEVSPSVKEVSREEVAEALQRMPALAWWMILALLRIVRALSTTSSASPRKQPQSSVS